MLHNICMRLLIFLLTLLTLISGCIPTSTREADETVNAKIQQKEENARLLRAIDAHVGSREYSKAREIFENGSFNQEKPDTCTNLISPSGKEIVLCPPLL